MLVAEDKARTDAAATHGDGWRRSQGQLLRSRSPPPTPAPDSHMSVDDDAMQAAGSSVFASAADKRVAEVDGLPDKEQRIVAGLATLRSARRGRPSRSQ